MPTLLQQLVGDLVGDKLDERAQKNLLEIDSVNALSIIGRMGSSKEEVRNPSAFVEKSVKSALSRGPPGALELEHATQQLRQASIIDEDAREKLKAASVEDAVASLSALLSQDVGSVRNTSAYVTRNLANARRNPGPAGGYPVGSFEFLERWRGVLDQKAIDGLRQLDPAQAMDICQELESKGPDVRNPSAYVQKACENRRNAPPPAGVSGLGTYGDGAGCMQPGCFGCGGACVGGYPPPSFAGYVGGYPAYPPACGFPGGCCYPVYCGGSCCGGCCGGYGACGCGACGGGCGAGAGFGGSGDGGLGALLVRYQGTLDSEAMDALRRAGPAAQQVLQALESKGGSVRNPSAYVVRAVQNLPGVAEGGPPPSGGGAFVDFGTASFGGGGGGGALGLDEKAQETLRELPPEVAEAIMGELRSKGSSINNPSAYVQRAAANARRGEGAAASAMPGGCGGSLPPPLPPPPPPPSRSRAPTFEAIGYEHMLARLDERATEAFNELGQRNPDEALSILRALDEQGDGVRNPSAYVLKSCGNAKRGVGGGGGGRGEHQRNDSGGFGGFVADGGGSIDELLAPWRVELDEMAQKALEGVGYQAAKHILSELEQKRDSVRNPSAYVCRAAKNEQLGAPLAGGVVGGSASFAWGPSPGGGGGGRPRDDDPALQEELAHEIAMIGVELDSKATDALNEVGPARALDIVRLLAAQGGKVNNPSAYITRAVANDRRGDPSGSAMKRPRVA